MRRPPNPGRSGQAPRPRRRAHAWARPRPPAARADRAGPPPEAPPPSLPQPVLPALVGHDGREVIRGELAHLRRGRAGAVGEEDLAFADTARVERELARRRVRGVVLPFDARPEVAVRDPGRLAAPAAGEGVGGR